MTADPDVRRSILSRYAISIADKIGEGKQFVLAHLRDHGLTDDDLALYRLFYAFRFLDTPRAGLLRWCLDTIRAAS